MKVYHLWKKKAKISLAILFLSSHVVQEVQLALQKQAIKKNLKDNITTTNVELYEAYSEWVDSVVSKEGWMSKQAVVMGQSIVDDFSKRNLDTALAVINIAALHGYRDMSWAINKFKDQYKFKREISIPNTPISVSSEAF